MMIQGKSSFKNVTALWSRLQINLNNLHQAKLQGANAQNGALERELHEVSLVSGRVGCRRRRIECLLGCMVVRGGHRFHHRLFSDGPLSPLGDALHVPRL